MLCLCLDPPLYIEKNSHNSDLDLHIISQWLYIVISKNKAIKQSRKKSVTETSKKPIENFIPSIKV